MPHDRLRPSLFDKVQEGEERNLYRLLDIIYGDLMSKVSLVETQLKGRLSSHEADLSRADSRMKKLEHCPCAVLRDPAHTCVVLDDQEKFAALELKMVQEVGKIKMRLSWWAGGFAFVLTILHLAAFFWPLFRG